MQAMPDQDGPSPQASLEPLAQELERLVLTARSIAAANLASLQVLTCFEIGRLLVEMLKYSPPGSVDGPSLPANLARQIGSLTAAALTSADLAAMRDFYLAWQDRAPAIRSGQADEQTVPLALSWPHYLCLLQVSDKPARDFYELQAIRLAWPLAELERQIQSELFASWKASPDPDAILVELEAHAAFMAGPGLKAAGLRDFYGLD